MSEPQRPQHPHLFSPDDDADPTRAAPEEALGRYLARTGRLPVYQGLALAVELLSALAFVHAQGRAHAGLAADQLRISPGGRLMLVEAAGDPAPVREDLEAAAVLVYELLTGQQPWRLRGGRRVLLPPGALRPELPLALDAVFERALGQRDEARYTSADAFSQALQAALGAPVWERSLVPPTPRNTAPVAAVQPMPRRIRRRQVALASMGALAAAALAGLLLLPPRHKGPQPGTVAMAGYMEAGSPSTGSGRTEGTPLRAEPGPGRAESATLPAAPSPGRMESAPVRAEPVEAGGPSTSPGRAEGTPLPAAPGPGRTKSASVRAEPSPGRTASTSVRAEPVEAGSPSTGPRRTESTPRRAERDPGRPESTPARVEPAEASPAPHSPAKHEPVRLAHKRRVAPAPEPEEAHDARPPEYALGCVHGGSTMRQLCAALRCAKPSNWDRPLCQRMQAQARARREHSRATIWGGP